MESGRKKQRQGLGARKRRIDQFRSRKSTEADAKIHDAIFARLMNPGKYSYEEEEFEELLNDEIPLFDPVLKMFPSVTSPAINAEALDTSVDNNETTEVILTDVMCGDHYNSDEDVLSATSPYAEPFQLISGYWDHKIYDDGWVKRSSNAKIKLLLSQDDYDTVFPSYASYHGGIPLPHSNKIHFSDLVNWQIGFCDMSWLFRMVNGDHPNANYYSVIRYFLEHRYSPEFDAHYRSYLIASNFRSTFDGLTKSSLHLKSTRLIHAIGAVAFRITHMISLAISVESIVDYFLYKYRSSIELRRPLRSYVVDRILNVLMKHESAVESYQYHTLRCVLMECPVIPSADRGRW